MIGMVHWVVRTVMVRYRIRCSVMAALLGAVAMAYGCRGCGEDPTPDPVPHAVSHWVQIGDLGARGDALAVDGVDWFVATADGLQHSADGGDSWAALAAAGLPEGQVLFLGVIPGEPRALLAHVWGVGLFHSTDDGASFAAIESPPLSPLVGSFLNPRPQVVPWQLAVDGDDVLMAAPGGVYRGVDGGTRWELLGVAPTGKVDLLFTGVDIDEGEAYCVSPDPASMLPGEFVDLYEAGISLSTDGGTSWDRVTGDMPARILTGVALDIRGTPYVSAMDGGLFRGDGEGHWEALGGPSDAVDVAIFEPGVAVASGSRGLWYLDPETGDWSQAGEGPVRALAGGAALMVDGTLWELHGGEGEPPPEGAGGTVYVALSFHVNLYHSYRGDTPDEDGFGQDIRVIRRTLEWLGEYPDVHGDWDIENAFSLDAWLPEHAPDIIDGLDARIGSGQDGLRIMSWNNGALASETREEFRRSVERAQQSYLDTFGTFDPGVQPQENMFSPHHVGWYRESGIEWITMFNSQTGFTAFPMDLTLTGNERYNPLTLRDGDDTMVLVPAYHHADVLDHGGLAAWARQISETHPGDSLLLVHMDGDAEIWENFDQELAAAQGLDFLQFTTIQDYLDGHEPVAEVTLPGDLADGTGDGFQSWAEKDFNHEIASGVVQARELADQAWYLGGGDAAVDGLLDAAYEPRLLALSTTHFGLAAPYLHPDRVETARQRVEESLAASQAAFDAAAALDPVAPGQVRVGNPRASAGAALVRFEVAVPTAAYGDLDALAVLDEGGSELAVEVWGPEDDGSHQLVQVLAVLDLEAGEQRTLTWRYDPVQPHTATGSLTTGSVAVPAALRAPFTECDGVGEQGSTSPDGDAHVEPRGVVASHTFAVDLPLCGESNSGVREVLVYEGLPGTVVRVSATIPEVDEPLDAESIALTPLACAGTASTLTWRTYAGETRTRPVRPLQESWNGQSADGWAAVTCADGSTIQVAHAVTERTSLAFLPIRTTGGETLLAPLGTLWGDGPWHDSRTDGGIGLADLITSIVGDQFEPAAPDWPGRTVEYTLLVGSGIGEGTLDLFAHPPLVEVGAYVAP